MNRKSSSFHLGFNSLSVYGESSKSLTYLCAGRPTLLSAPLENQAARLFKSTESGLTVPPQRDDLFRQAADRLRQDSNLRIIMGNNARRYAMKDFQINRIGAEFLEIILSNE